MAETNPFSAIAERYRHLPSRLQRPLVTRAIGDTIPFVRTAECYVETYEPTEVAVMLENRPDVQNHLGGLHAAALALLAETASGLVVALNVPDESAPLLRTMDVSFDRFGRSAARATATLSKEETRHIQSRPIGRLDVSVSVQGPGNETLVASTLEWAWLPEERLGPS